tara:strand:- start:274 stop:477 length:204 start_codon:yes stop_codon:yes gene_type:complete
LAEATSHTATKATAVVSTTYIAHTTAETAATHSWITASAEPRGLHSITATELRSLTVSASHSWEHTA